MSVAPCLRRRPVNHIVPAKALAGTQAGSTKFSPNCCLVALLLLLSSLLSSPWRAAARAAARRRPEQPPLPPASVSCCPPSLLQQQGRGLRLRVATRATSRGCATSRSATAPSPRRSARRRWSSASPRCAPSTASCPLATANQPRGSGWGRESSAEVAVGGAGAAQTCKPARDHGASAPLCPSARGGPERVRLLGGGAGPPRSRPPPTTAAVAAGAGATGLALGWAWAA